MKLFQSGMMPRLIQQEQAMLVGIMNDDGSAIYWYDVPPAQYGSAQAGSRRVSDGERLGYYSTEYYNYHTDGNPATYSGMAYGNYRGYGNTSGYVSNYSGYIRSTGYISRPGYSGRWSSRY
jgi:hypothetical protein